MPRSRTVRFLTVRIQMVSILVNPRILLVKLNLLKVQLVLPMKELIYRDNHFTPPIIDTFGLLVIV